MDPNAQRRITLGLTPSFPGVSGSHAQPHGAGAMVRTRSHANFREPVLDGVGIPAQKYPRSSLDVWWTTPEHAGEIS